MLPAASAAPSSPSHVAMRSGRRRSSGRRRRCGGGGAGCALYCLWVRRLLAGEALLSAWHEALSEARGVAHRGSLAPDTPGPSPLPDHFWQRLEGAETVREEELQPGGYAGYVVDCLQA